ILRGNRDFLQRKFPNPPKKMAISSEEIGERMLVNYQNIRKSLCKIANLAVLMIRNTYYMIAKIVF
ncbi:MAG: hypothetical protein LBQ65_05650, partial [Tannerellaceae bacterium]|nr:hypothetical protein [Tannerellaceae bacterium]